MALQPPLRAGWTGALTVFFLGTILLSGSLQAADTERCARKARIHLAELSVGEDEVRSMRLIERIKVDDRAGSDIQGIDAWVRLKSCDGWLVINMSAACFIRQSYTRGACQVEGLSNY